MNIKEMVTDNKKVTFVRYCDFEFWYVTECGFEFPIPLEDAKGATLLATDKALYFMRWIRKHDKFLTDARNAQNESR